VIRAELCGSLRRRRETAKDIDILISSADAKPIMEAFVSLPEVMQVVAHGETKSSIVAAMTVDREKVILNADLRVVADECFPFALHYFTGSKEHNVRLRSRAIDQGLSLNEYGLKGEGRDVKCATEADIFAALGLEFIPPELREDTGEIEAAEKKKLPHLITVKNLRGVFHNHSTYSDGNASLEEMALAAKALGLEYFGIGDHSQSLRIARGLSPEMVKKQHREIDELNARLHGVRILKGIESDILDDGSLDYDDETLQSFDYVVASVHTGFNMSSEEMTARICKALAHPATTMLGHATGRLLLRRDGYKVDLDQVLKAAAKHGKMIEINAHPVRLDLDWIHVKRAKAMGIPLVINPDAHSTGELALIEFGIDVARRGWLEAADVFNTKPLAEVMKELNRRKAAWAKD
jgi:DNA polymerase (family 10)